MRRVLEHILVDSNILDPKDYMNNWSFFVFSHWHIDQCGVLSEAMSGPGPSPVTSIDISYKQFLIL